MSRSIRVNPGTDLEYNMPLKVVRRRAGQVPPPPKKGKVNKDLELLRTAIAELTADAVLEIDAGSAAAVKAVKSLVTRASHMVGIEIWHYHVGSKVYAAPKAAAKPAAKPGAKPATRTAKATATPRKRAAAQPAAAAAKRGGSRPPKAR